MPPKGSKRAASNGASGSPRAKAKAKSGGALQGIPADAQKMAHMILLDKWLILGNNERGSIFNVCPTTWVPTKVGSKEMVVYRPGQRM